MIVLSRYLYTFFRSSTSFRLRIALRYKGLDYESHFVSLPRMEHQDAAYRVLNPQGLLPLLVDGGRSYIQSMSIIEYLDEAYPEPPLIPKEINARAYVRAVSQIIGCEMHPLNNVRVLKHLRIQFAADDDAVQAWYAHWIAVGFSGLEDYLSSVGRHATYCCGEQITMADVCLVPQVFNAQRFGCSIDQYKILKGIFERCMELDAFQSAQPKLQADAF